VREPFAEGQARISSECVQLARSRCRAVDGAKAEQHCHEGDAIVGRRQRLCCGVKDRNVRKDVLWDEDRVYVSDVEDERQDDY